MGPASSIQESVGINTRDVVSYRQINFLWLIVIFLRILVMYQNFKTCAIQKNFNMNDKCDKTCWYVLNSFFRQKKFLFFIYKTWFVRWCSHFFLKVICTLRMVDLTYSRFCHCIWLKYSLSYIIFLYIYMIVKIRDIFVI